MHTNKKSSESQSSPTFSVYVILCVKTNMHYVGITKNQVKSRIRNHKKGKQFVDKQIREIGWDGNWDWWIVEENVPSELISEREQYWVSFFDCVYPKGYNKTCGGIGNIIVSEDTREILRQNALARNMSGENNPHYGKRHTDEVKAAQSARMKGENNPNYGKSPANKGVPWTEEQKAEQSARMKGEKNPFFGKHHTDEAKEKNRQAHLGKPSARKGKKHKEESKALMREKALERDVSGEKNPFYGKHHTPETKAVLSAKMSGENGPMYGKSPTNKGVPHTEEEKAKMREKALAREAKKRAEKEAAKKAAEEAAKTAEENAKEIAEKTAENSAEENAQKTAESTQEKNSK